MKRRNGTERNRKEAGTDGPEKASGEEQTAFRPMPEKVRRTRYGIAAPRVARKRLLIYRYANTSEKKRARQWRMKKTSSFIRSPGEVAELPPTPFERASARRISESICITLTPL